MGKDCVIHTEMTKPCLPLPPPPAPACSNPATYFLLFRKKNTSKTKLLKCGTLVCVIMHTPTQLAECQDVLPLTEKDDAVTVFDTSSSSSSSTAQGMYRMLAEEKYAQPRKSSSDRLKALNDAIPLRRRNLLKVNALVLQRIKYLTVTENIDENAAFKKAVMELERMYKRHDSIKWHTADPKHYVRPPEQPWLKRIPKRRKNVQTSNRPPPRAERRLQVLSQGGAQQSLWRTTVNHSTSSPPQALGDGSECRPSLVPGPLPPGVERQRREQLNKLKAEDNDKDSGPAKQPIPSICVEGKLRTYPVEPIVPALFMNTSSQTRPEVCIYNQYMPSSYSNAQCYYVHQSYRN
eukprot:GHVQ01041084.1.p1 GENE.GHVQ01041084.1~~GHVQ01041084.1.p1  ORF type:complete len:349 (-),score=58.96 GHVQ01041084.1:157-1203(-)